MKLRAESMGVVARSLEFTLARRRPVATGADAAARQAHGDERPRRARRAHAAGIPLERAVETVAGFEPVAARMSPMVWTASHSSVTTTRRLRGRSTRCSSSSGMPGRRGRSRRRHDLGLPGSGSTVYERLARSALAVADEVAFVGSQSGHVRKLVAEADGALHVFSTVRAAADHFAADLRDGDLVVLKGSNRADHLFRILLARTTGVAVLARGVLSPGVLRRWNCSTSPADRHLRTGRGRARRYDAPLCIVTSQSSEPAMSACRSPRSSPTPDGRCCSSTSAPSASPS